MTATQPARSSPGVVQTLRWEQGRLGLLDQRALPQVVEYRWCDCAADVAEAIRTMVVRGAPAIGCAAAYGLALEAKRLAHLEGARFLVDLRRAAQDLAGSRPTAVNLNWAVQRLRGVQMELAEASPQIVADAMLREAMRIHAEDLDGNLAMGAFGAALIPDGARVLTHCNAGALATAGHGTALGVIRSAVAAGKRVQVFADETRPLLQGARLTAWELTQDGVPTTLIADVAAGHLMSRGEIDLVIVGADRVAANGDTANKIGTYPLAVLAERHGVPFYVACPLSTIDLSSADGNRIPIEERAADEITGFGSLRWAPQRVSVRNPAFDITPAALITALITERGVVKPPREKALRALFSPV